MPPTTPTCHAQSEDAVACKYGWSDVYQGKNLAAAWWELCLVGVVGHSIISQQHNFTKKVVRVAEWLCKDPIALHHPSPHATQASHQVGPDSMVPVDQKPLHNLELCKQGHAWLTCRDGSIAAASMGKGWFVVPPSVHCVAWLGP